MPCFFLVYVEERYIVLPFHSFYWCFWCCVLHLSLFFAGLVGPFSQLKINTQVDRQRTFQATHGELLETSRFNIPREKREEEGTLHFPTFKRDIHDRSKRYGNVTFLPNLVSEVCKERSLKRHKGAVLGMRFSDERVQSDTQGHRS